MPPPLSRQLQPRLDHHALCFVAADGQAPALAGCLASKFCINSCSPAALLAVATNPSASSSMVVPWMPPTSLSSCGSAAGWRWLSRTPYAAARCLLICRRQCLTYHVVEVQAVEQEACPAPCCMPQLVTKLPLRSATVAADPDARRVRNRGGRTHLAALPAGTMPFCPFTSKLGSEAARPEWVVQASGPLKCERWGRPRQAAAADGTGHMYARIHVHLRLPRVRSPASRCSPLWMRLFFCPTQWCVQGDRAAVERAAAAAGGKATAH